MPSLVNRWFIYVELNFLMQKAFHFYERPLSFRAGRLGSVLRYAVFGGYAGSVLRYAVASDGYAGANDFSTSWPAARCPFGNLRRGQLVKDRIRI